MPRHKSKRLTHIRVKWPDMRIAPDGGSRQQEYHQKCESYSNERAQQKYASTHTCQPHRLANLFGGEAITRQHVVHQNEASLAWASQTAQQAAWHAQACCQVLVGVVHRVWSTGDVRETPVAELARDLGGRGGPKSGDFGYGTAASATGWLFGYGG